MRSRTSRPSSPKSFRHVNFNVRKGEILGVAGLVGAQRTELMEGLFGLRCHTSGTITYKGKELTINQPQDAIKNGIAMLTEGPPRHRYFWVCFPLRITSPLHR